MLQKLETTYLNILRIVVIAASGLLLVGSIFFGISSLQGFGSGPEAEIDTPEVSKNEIIKQITNPSPAESAQEPSEAPEETQVDPNKAYYDRATTAIINFSIKYSGGTENLSKESIYEFTKNKAEAYPTPELVSGFAKGLAESMENILSEESVIKAANASSPLDIINKTLDLFQTEFNKQIDASAEANTAAQQEHLEDKADAATNIYIAAACFGIFLLVVFLSIFIKIERNLRHLEVKSPEAA